MKKTMVIQTLRMIILSLWGAILFGGLLLIFSYILKNGVGSIQEDIAATVLSYHDLKVPLFLLLFALRGLLLILPSSLLVVIAGFLFNPWDAFFLSLLGQMISAVLLYGVASFVGKKFILAHGGEFIKKLNTTLSQKGFFATLILVIIPIVPVDTVTVAAAVTSIAFLDFFLGVLLGCAISFLPLLFLGEALGSVKGMLLALFPFFLLVLITIWAWKHPHFRTFFRKK